MVLVFTLLTSTTAFASSAKSNIKVTVNNKTVQYNVKPYIKGKDVMVPLQQTAQSFGAKVTWDKKSKTAWVNFNLMNIEITPGKKEIYIHRDADFSGIPEVVKLNTPIVRVKGKIVVPAIKFFGSMGMSVTWNSEKRILSISSSPLSDCEVAYENIPADFIKGNENLMTWYNENNMKPGISYKRDGEYVYVLIGAGEKPTGGYTIQIDKIFFSSVDTVLINARVNPPGDNVRVIMMITYPSTLIRFKSDTVKTVIGDIIDVNPSDKEKWITMDSTTVSKMELYSQDNVKLKDITGSDSKAIISSFAESIIDPNPYVKMIAGNVLKATMKDGYILTFTSYGSKTNVIVNFEKDDDNRSYHLVAPAIAEILLRND
jgi:hypothetical protein